MLIVDEMGKFLEHAAYENGDIFIFPEIAEKFNRSQNQIYLWAFFIKQ